MKEHPLLMSTQMVRAILDGKKSMTRRVVTPGTSIVGEGKVDWSNFCWDGSETYDFGDTRYSTSSEFVSDELKGQLIGISKAPLPFVDNSVSPEYGADHIWQYLHVPYRWSEDATIFRIYPKWEVGDELWVRENFCYIAGGRLVHDFGVKYQADQIIKWWRDNEGWMNYPINEKGRPSIHMPRWACRIEKIIKLLRVERLLDISEPDAKAEGFNSTDEFLSYWDIMNKKRGYGTDVNPWNWVIGW